MQQRAVSFSILKTKKLVLAVDPGYGFRAVHVEYAPGMGWHTDPTIKAVVSGIGDRNHKVRGGRGCRGVRRGDTFTYKVLETTRLNQ